MTGRRSPLELIVPLLVTAVQLGSAFAVLGMPDLPAARDFLTGTLPTMGGSIAAAQAVLWVALLVAFVGVVAGALTGTASSAGAARRSAAWSLTVAVVGLVILATGIDHRAGAGTVTLTGGSLQEARAQLAR